MTPATNLKRLTVPAALRHAIAGETSAARKYARFAEHADTHDFPHVANLFRAAARAEQVHIKNHTNALGETVEVPEPPGEIEAVVGSVAENLRAAIAGETFETKKMYPAFVKAAKKARGAERALADVARVSFEYAGAAERVHAGLFEEALEHVERGEDLPVAKFFVCQACGNVELEAPPASCPVCDHPAMFFEEVA